MPWRGERASRPIVPRQLGQRLDQTYRANTLDHTLSSLPIRTEDEGDEGDHLYLKSPPDSNDPIASSSPFYV